MNQSSNVKNQTAAAGSEVEMLTDTFPALNAREYPAKCGRRPPSVSGSFFFNSPIRELASSGVTSHHKSSRVIPADRGEPSQSKKKRKKDRRPELGAHA